MFQNFSQKNSMETFTPKRKESDFINWSRWVKTNRRKTSCRSKCYDRKLQKDMHFSKPKFGFKITTFSFEARQELVCQEPRNTKKMWRFLVPWKTKGAFRMNFQHKGRKFDRKGFKIYYLLVSGLCWFQDMFKMKKKQSMNFIIAPKSNYHTKPGFLLGLWKTT